MAKRGPKTKKYTKKRRKELVILLKEYIEENEIPILAEFGYKNGIPKSSLYDIEELDELRQLAILKKEANLEREGLRKDSNTAFVCFSLKQLGWSDNIKTTNVNVGVDIDDIDENELDKEIEKLQKIVNVGFSKR
jgi:hypothetical protein